MEEYSKHIHKVFKPFVKLILAQCDDLNILDTLRDGVTKLDWRRTTVVAGGELWRGENV